MARKASSQLAPSAEQAAAPAPAAFMAEGKSERQDSDGEEEMEGDQASVADSMAESVQLEVDGGSAQEDCCEGEEEKGQEEQEQPQTEMADQPGEVRKRGGLDEPEPEAASRRKKSRGGATAASLSPVQERGRRSAAIRAVGLIKKQADTLLRGGETGAEGESGGDEDAAADGSEDDGLSEAPAPKGPVGRGPDAAELAEPEEDLGVWGGRIFELGLDGEGRVERVTTRRLLDGGGVLEAVRIQNMRGGRRWHRWEDRMQLPRAVLRRMARRAPLKNAECRPDGVRYLCKPYKLPRAAVSHVFAYRAQHARTAAELEQVGEWVGNAVGWISGSFKHSWMAFSHRLASLEKHSCCACWISASTTTGCRSWPPIRASSAPCAPPSTPRPTAASSTASTGGPALGSGCTRTAWTCACSRPTAAPWWRRPTPRLCAPSSSARRSVAAYASVLCKLNVNADYGFRSPPPHTQKAAGKLRKRILGFRKETQEFWQEIKERFMAQVSQTAAAAAAVATTTTAGMEEAAGALVASVEAAPAGQALLAEARDGWTRLYEAFKAQSLEHQHKVWRLEQLPAWEIKVRARTYASVDPALQIAHDLAELRSRVKAELGAWQQQKPLTV